MHRKRVLFIAEGVTLAHVTRPLVLARSLDPDRFEVHFACTEGYDFVFQDDGIIRWTIKSISVERFLRSLASGARVYDTDTLAAYVEDDLKILGESLPDMVIGDFRLSLSVSAPLCEVRHVAIANAHWSPYAVGDFPVPDHPVVPVIGVSAAKAFFRLARPVIFAYHSQPLNNLRRKHGLASLGDLRNVYTHGDYTVYVDTPTLVPTEKLPPHHHYIGPVIWSPKFTPPPWWSSLPGSRKNVYVTLGSSGNVELLSSIVDALDALPLNVMVSMAGRALSAELPSGVWASDYLPGTLAIRRSAFVVCNGGSATVYQALAEGVPVLGVASNLDQFLTMSYVERAGAGLLLRAGTLTVDAVRRAAENLLDGDGYRRGARTIAEEFARFPAPARFASLVDSWL